MVPDVAKKRVALSSALAYNNLKRNRRNGAATAAPRCPSETRCNLLEKSKSNLTKWSVLVLVTLFFLGLLQIACNSVSGPGDLINYVSEAS